MPKKLTRHRRKAREYPDWRIREKSGGRTVYIYQPDKSNWRDVVESRVIVQIRGKRPGVGWHISEVGNQADLSKMTGPFDSFDAAAACYAVMFTSTTNRFSMDVSRQAMKSAALGAAYGANALVRVPK